MIRCAHEDDAAHHRSLFGPLLAILAGSGCRLSEALGLCWGDDGLDLEAEPVTIRIDRSSTKTDAGTRVVPVDATTAAVLRRHFLASGRPANGKPVFPDAQGNPRNRHGAIPDGIARIAKAAGLPGVTAHVFRHAHATWLAGAGVPPASAAARLGHSDGGGLFLRVYAHPGVTEAQAALVAVTAFRNRESELAATR